jgi:hypothetical protein
MSSFQADQAATVVAEAERRKTVLLYRNAGIAQAVTVINAGLVAYVNATLHTAVGVAFVWWVLITLLAAGRYLLARRFAAARPDAIATMTWRRRYIGATAAMAAAWGAGTVLFMWQAPVVGRALSISVHPRRSVSSDYSPAGCSGPERVFYSSPPRARWSQG